MTFVDITAVPVPTDHRTAFELFSRRMAEVYRDHGATRVTDYWQAAGTSAPEDFHADGADYEEGRLREIGAVLGVAGAESLVITVTEWPSRQVRDAGTAAATSDPRVLATLDEDPVFDGGRLLGGSFEVGLDLGV